MLCWKSEEQKKKRNMFPVLLFLGIFGIFITTVSPLLSVYMPDILDSLSTPLSEDGILEYGYLRVYNVSLGLENSDYVYADRRSSLFFSRTVARDLEDGGCFRAGKDYLRKTIGLDYIDMDWFMAVCYVLISLIIQRIPNNPRVDEAGSLLRTGQNVLFFSLKYTLLFTFLTQGVYDNLFILPSLLILFSSSPMIEDDEEERNPFLSLSAYLGHKKAGFLFLSVLNMVFFTVPSVLLYYFLKTGVRVLGPLFVTDHSFSLVSFTPLLATGRNGTAAAGCSGYRNPVCLLSSSSKKIFGNICEGLSETDGTLERCWDFGVTTSPDALELGTPRYYNYTPDLFCRGSLPPGSFLTESYEEIMDIRDHIDYAYYVVLLVSSTLILTMIYYSLLKIFKKNSISFGISFLKEVFGKDTMIVYKIMSECTKLVLLFFVVISFSFDSIATGLTLAWSLYFLILFAGMYL